MKQWFLTLTIALALTSGLSAQEKTLEIVDRFRQILTSSQGEPIEMPAQGIAIYDGNLSATPLNLNLLPLGGGVIIQSDIAFRGLPALMVLTYGYGSGGTIAFTRPLKLTRPLTEYELVITFVPPVLIEETTQPSTETGGGAGGTGSPSLGGVSGSGGGGAQPPFGGPPGLGGITGGPIVPPTGGRGRVWRRYLFWSSVYGGQTGTGQGAIGGGVGGLGIGGAGIGGQAGVSPPSGAGGGSGETTGQQRITITLKYLTFLFITDKGIYPLTFQIPPDRTINLENDWATIIVPLRLIGQSPEHPILLHRLAITGDAPEELYFGRIYLRPRTDEELSISLRGQAMEIREEKEADGSVIKVFVVRLNQTLNLEILTYGVPYPLDFRWDFTTEYGTNFDSPDAYGHQASFSFNKVGIKTCAVKISDVFGASPPLVQRFKVEVIQ